MTTLKERTALVKEKSTAANKAQTDMTNAFMELLDATFELAYAVGFSHGRIEKAAGDEAECESPNPDEKLKEETNAEEESDTTDTVEPTAAG